jgi:hypothetical protein
MTTTTTAVSAAPSFAESTLGALLKGLTKQIGAQRHAEADVEYIQDRIEEASNLLAELRDALEGAQQCKRAARIVRDKLEREARAQGADDDDILQAARESWHLDQL